MVLKTFSEYVQKFNADIPSVILLSEWLNGKLSKAHENNIERVIHSEIANTKKRGLFLITGKTDS